MNSKCGHYSLFFIQGRFKFERVQIYCEINLTFMKRKEFSKGIFNLNLCLV